MKPSLGENPEYFVLQIGTNDLNSDRPAELITKSITDVGSSLKNDSHDVSISRIVVENDNLRKRPLKLIKTLKNYAQNEIYISSITQRIFYNST